MTPRKPDFDDLIGTDVPAEERERLNRVHELLVQADQPPELSPELDAVPWPNEALAPLSFRRKGRERRRSWLGLAAAAAAIALVAFIIGQGRSSPSSFAPVAKRAMHGTSLVPAAKATIAVGSRGRDGNWPMLVDIVDLPPAPAGGYYMLWLSRNGKPVAPCGSFNTGSVNRETIVRLSAAYSFSGINGWIVTREVPGANNRQIVMTT